MPQLSPYQLTSECIVRSSYAFSCQKWAKCAKSTLLLSIHYRVNWSKSDLNKQLQHTLNQNEGKNRYTLSNAKAAPSKIASTYISTVSLLLLKICFKFLLVCTARPSGKERAATKVKAFLTKVSTWKSQDIFLDNQAIFS